MGIEGQGGAGTEIVLKVIAQGIMQQSQPGIPMSDPNCPQSQPQPTTEPTQQPDQQVPQSSSSSSSQSIDHYADDTPLPKSQPFDLKALWLGDTNSALDKFNATYNQLKTQQQGIQEGFKIFAENENRYRLSSLRKIVLNLDKKQLYNEYMLKTRKTIEKVSPVIIVNILSYVSPHLFMNLVAMRRVSKIFNEIYLSESIQAYLAERDYLYNGTPAQALKSSVSMCRKYMNFYRTFMYYKEMQYTEQIPQNSITRDFQSAVNFINEVHRLVINRQNRAFTYYELMNRFMKRHRVVIGLSSLSLTSLVLVRKAAIIAFSNYLAFNEQERSKEQITKTKYSKVINVVEYEDYHDSLIINTRISNYLWDRYGINFAVLVTSNLGAGGRGFKVRRWNLLVYHIHNEDKAVYLEDVELDNQRYNSARLDLEFDHDMQMCRFATIEYSGWVKMEAQGKVIDTIVAESKGKQAQQFSYCHFYKLEQYYVIAVPAHFQ